MEKDNMRQDSLKFKELERNYWRYYRELEDELISTRKYVDFQKENFGTYSVEFLKLFQAVCSEIDVIGKAMAMDVDSTFKPGDGINNIYKWWYIIQNQYFVSYKLSDDCEKVALKDYIVCFVDEFDIIPWKEFITEEYSDKNGSIRYRTVDSKGSPSWWTDYNKVKHQRTSFISQKGDETYYTKASLGNVCKAFAALYVLESAYLQAVGTKNDLESFADYSVLFSKKSFCTSDDIQKIWDKTFN